VSPPWRKKVYEDLLEMAAGCVETIQAHVEKLAELEEELAGLEGRTCTGWEWWRDVDVPGKAPKLYILHSIDGGCPTHGQPEPEKRLRVYVGIDGERIRAAREGIAREEERRRLEARARRIRSGLVEGESYLRKFYLELPRSHSDYVQARDGVE